MRINFEQSLKERLLGGEKEAFAMAVELCKDLVYTSALGVVKNKHDAEDITQDTFTLLFNKRNSINPETDIPSWLYVTSIFISKRFLRDKKIEKHHEKEIELMNKENAEDKELQDVILQEISSLSSKYREVLFRHYILEEKYTDIARNLGMNLSTVSMQIKRGLEQLRLNLGKKGYVVSTVTLIGLASSLNSVNASCNLSSAVITDSIYRAKTEVYKIYKPKKDSISLKVYRENKSHFLSNTFVFGMASIFLVGAIIWFLPSKNKTFYSQRDSTLKPRYILQENTLIKIWNHGSQNLNELIYNNPGKVIKTNPISKISYIGNISLSLSHLILPYRIPETPIKVTLKTFGENNGHPFSSFGPMVIEKNIGLPFYHRTKSASLQDRTKSSGETIIYILENMTMTGTDGIIFSQNQYLKNLNGKNILIHNVNVGIFEVRIDKLTKDEIEFFKKTIADYKLVPSIYSPEVLLSKQ